MNILLTGGSGFIGKNIIEQLGGKYNIFAPRHRELDLVDENQVREFFTRHSIDVVIHSAVKPGHRNASDLEGLLYSNARMYFNLVRNAPFFKKMIFLSSGAVYDVSQNLSKVKEEEFDTFVPKDEHGFSKYLCAQHVSTADNVIELRLFGVFGKYEDYAIRFISNAICKSLFDLPITLRRNRKFDYIYIDDFISILEYFIENTPEHKVYNVTPDRAVELKDLALMVKDLSGKNLPILVAQEGMGNEYSGDNSRLKEELKGVCIRPIEDAIQSLYRWYEQNLSSLNREVLLYDK